MIQPKPGDRAEFIKQGYSISEKTGAILTVKEIKNDGIVKLTASSHLFCWSIPLKDFNEYFKLLPSVAKTRKIQKQRG